jgi:hypothetical protein
MFIKLIGPSIIDPPNIWGFWACEASANTLGGADEQPVEVFD